MAIAQSETVSTSDEVCVAVPTRSGAPRVTGLRRRRTTSDLPEAGAATVLLRVATTQRQPSVPKPGRRCREDKYHLRHHSHELNLVHLMPRQPVNQNDLQADLGGVNVQANRLLAAMLPLQTAAHCHQEAIGPFGLDQEPRPSDHHDIPADVSVTLVSLSELDVILMTEIYTLSVKITDNPLVRDVTYWCINSLVFTHVSLNTFSPFAISLFYSFFLFFSDKSGERKCSGSVNSAEHF
ncbi:uncharacterized protein [Takifugu rubripes]|uniref:uncharacterized protein n=1 Tax=Takifugu rubripes TaxID=31033 RepID=UPI001145850B|nr:uncharacterized protein LOC115250829 [Takifugu rubripes]